ncbi:MAG TPA: alkaline phosphatase family protein [Bryobacteraceae bacterium]|nr:alkaline phosphatase family protein [Bryobacteraceae bacterium]
MKQIIGVLFAASLLAQSPVRRVTDPGVVTTRQEITPAGVPAVFDGRVFGVVFGRDSFDLYVLAATGLYRYDWAANKVVERLDAGRRPSLQGVAFDPVAGHALFSGADRAPGVWLARALAGKPIVAEKLGASISGAPVVASKGCNGGPRLAALPLIFNNQVAFVDLDGARPAIKADVSTAPASVVISDDSCTAWVSHWGGRKPKPGEKTAPTGLAKTADQVPIDARGVAASGTVSRIDAQSGKVIVEIETGLAPTSLAWDQGRNRLYVANSNADSVSVIDTSTNKLLATWTIDPFDQRAPGVAPTALALDAKARRLYVALGGINAVAILDTTNGRLTGMIPTAWYPSSLALSSDGKRLAVGALLGAGSGWRDTPKQRYVHTYRGSAAVIDIPDAAQLANFSTAVAENTHLTLKGRSVRQPVATGPRPAPKAIPARSGDPSLIEHVVYIVKENRTYDQLFGDLPAGDGDPSLVMFGQDVTPNQRALARRYVLMDRFFATGGNSANGHQWVTQANEVAYTLWPGYEGRSYPYDGTDPLAYSRGGFLWDAALKAGKTVKVYGEYAPRLSEAKPPQRAEYLARWRKGDDFSTEFKVSSPIPPLDALLARNYPTYTNAVPDQVRASIFLKDVEAWTQEKKMPNLVIVQLPSNHTYGATPDASSPKAMVADNDLALGRIVEGLSHSPFWPKMAVFVVEDDAQNGVDHVDGHRTVATVASPYARRGAVDSTFYSNQSIVKTIELILGLPALSLFDLIANDMRACFSDTPNPEPYIALTPTQSLDDLNPPVAALRGKARQAAIDSAKMRWEVPDAAPTERLNRIVWGMIRGWDKPYPQPPQNVFAPLSLDIDDDDR